MRVVLAGHTSATGPLRVGSHHLARELAAAGHQVVHLSAPISPLHLALWRDPLVRTRLRRRVVDTGDGYPEVTLWLPLPPRALERRPDAGARLWSWARPRPARALEALGAWPVDLLVIDYPYGAGLVETLHPGTSVYRATDVYPLLRDRPGIAAVEQRIVDAVDHLVATSGPAAEHLSGLAGPDRPVAVIPNAAAGAPARPSAAARAVRDGLSGPVAVYAGVVDHRFDVDLLDALARARPEVSFLLVGPTDGATVAERPNVHRIGPLAHEDLLGLLPLCDVGLLLTNDHPANQGRSPIKVFEYAAAGLASVVRRTTEVERLDLAGALVYDDESEALHRLDRALAGDAKVVPGPTWADRRDELLAVVGA